MIAQAREGVGEAQAAGPDAAGGRGRRPRTGRPNQASEAACRRRPAARPPAGMRSTTRAVDAAATTAAHDAMVRRRRPRTRWSADSTRLRDQRGPERPAGGGDLPGVSPARPGTIAARSTTRCGRRSPAARRRPPAERASRAVAIAEQRGGPGHPQRRVGEGHDRRAVALDGQASEQRPAQHRPHAQRSGRPGPQPRSPGRPGHERSRQAAGTAPRLPRPAARVRWVSPRWQGVRPVARRHPRPICSQFAQAPRRLPALRGSSCRSSVAA